MPFFFLHSFPPIVIFSQSKLNDFYIFVLQMLNLHNFFFLSYFLSFFSTFWEFKKLFSIIIFSNITIELLKYTSETLKIKLCINNTM